MVTATVGFLAFGSVGFWILAGFVCLLLIAAVEWEKPGWATISLGVTAALLAYFGDVNVFAFVRHHPFSALALVVGYFVLGTLWSFGKWWFYLRNAREEYDEMKKRFLSSHGVVGTQIPDRCLQEWQKIYPLQRSVTPKARDNKGRIMTWMVYWPWSFVWTIVNDPVKRMFKSIFRQFQTVYQGIANKVFAGTEADFREPTSPVPGATPEDEGSVSRTPPSPRRPGSGRNLP